MNDWLVMWMKTTAGQVALGVIVVMVVGAVAFALIWSIIMNQPLNPVAANIIAFLTGGGVTLIGGQIGAHHVTAGVTQGATVTSDATNAATPATPATPTGVSETHA